MPLWNPPLLKAEDFTGHVGRLYTVDSDPARVDVRLDGVRRFAQGLCRCSTPDERILVEMAMRSNSKRCV